MIDTSSARSALAVVAAGGARPGRTRPPAAPAPAATAPAENVFESGRESDLGRLVAELVSPAELDAVVIATGPGSFTGLRLGAGFGVGLAMGLGVRLLGLPSLALQAARAREPATALIEAGRGRVYWLDPAGEPRLGSPAELPAGRPGVGWLRPATATLVREVGIRLLEDSELDRFAVAAARILGRARELAYGTVSLEYMASFGPVRD